jgi:hypothetical protein
MLSATQVGNVLATIEIDNGGKFAVLMTLVHGGALCLALRELLKIYNILFVKFKIF